MINGHWLPAKDGDPRAYALMRRHYSFHPYRDGRRQDLGNPNRNLFVGPGQKKVWLTVDCLALWVWRKFIDASGQQGVNCAVFHNESGILASELILEAEQIAWQLWPSERLYTYVDDKQVSSVNPGYCFKRAGWQLVRDETGKPARTGSGLLILEKLPSAN